MCKRPWFRYTNFKGKRRKPSTGSSNNMEGDSEWPNRETIALSINVITKCVSNLGPPPLLHYLLSGNLKAEMSETILGIPGKYQGYSS